MNQQTQTNNFQKSMHGDLLEKALFYVENFEKPDRHIDTRLQGRYKNDGRQTAKEIRQWLDANGYSLAEQNRSQYSQSGDSESQGQQG